MLRDSALQQGSAALQKLTRERFNKANVRMIELTFVLVFITVLGTMASSYFYTASCAAG